MQAEGWWREGGRRRRCGGCLLAIQWWQRGSPARLRRRLSAHTPSSPLKAAAAAKIWIQLPNKGRGVLGGPVGEGSTPTRPPGGGGLAGPHTSLRLSIMACMSSDLLFIAFLLTVPSIFLDVSPPGIFLSQGDGAPSQLGWAVGRAEGSLQRGGGFSLFWRFGRKNFGTQE